MIKEDKATLARQRAELVERLTTPLSVEDRMRLQGELSLVNAKIRAWNTTEAAMNKAAADQRKVAGLAEAQANAARARANVGLPVVNDASDDDDPGQTAAIDGWIDAVLLRHDVDFTRATGTLVMLKGNPARRDVPQKLAAAIEALVAGIYAAARGQELPDLTDLPIAPNTPKAQKAPKSRKR